MSGEGVLGGDAGKAGAGAEGDKAADAGSAGKSAASGGDGAAGGSDAGAAGGDAGDGAKAPEWLKDIPAEYRDDPSMKVIQDVPNLVKSYVNAQRLIGKDKINVPAEFATDAEWRGVKQKLGLPEKEGDYNIKLPEGHKLDEGFVKSLKEKAFELGILPKDLEGMIGWYDKTNQASIESLTSRAAAEVETELKAYKQESGDNYDKNVLKANAAIREFAPEGFEQFMSDNGLASSVPLIKLLANVGAGLAEDKIVGEAGVKFGMTPDEMSGEMGRMRSDPKSAYNDSRHPDHELAVAKMFKYTTELHSSAVSS